MTHKVWLARHTFLEPIARLETTVEEVIKALPERGFIETNFEPYSADFREGVALLRSETLGRKLLLQSAGTFEHFALALSKAPIHEALASKVRELYEHIHKTPGQIDQALVSIATEAEQASSLPHLGTARYIAWTALAHALAPTIAAFDAWKENATWSHGYCPVCGNAPLLSVLTEQEAGRQRSLVCGLCKVQWKVKRLGCPHCATEDEDKLAILELADEPDLRLEVCNGCKGYLKTWAGEGKVAPPYFSDWATLHLDAMATERGYLRLGASLYEL
jgi:FdhE protein